MRGCNQKQALCSHRKIARRKMSYKVFMSMRIVIVYAEIPNTGFTHTTHTRNTWPHT